jgi:uncharacterized membrane protein
MNSNNDKSRFIFIDVLRGFTIILMIFFHFSFDLNLLGFLHFDIMRQPFWYFLPRLIVFLFFFAVGMSLALVHQPQIRWRIFFKRFAKLAVLAGVVSLTTFFMFPENWIYFGTLHSIAIVSLLSLPFLKYPKTSLMIALLLFLPSMIWDKNLPWFELSHPSFDYISPFPWVGACLLGIYAISKNIHKIYCNKNVRIIKSLNFLGHHSLFIYLAHQPILFSLLYVIKHIYEK